MDHGQPASGQDNFKKGLGWAAFICWSLASSVEVFLHESRSFGQRYLGLQAAAAIPLIFVFPLLLPDRDVQPLLNFLLAYLVLCGISRFAVTARLRRGGASVHSFYTGRPRIMRLTGRMSEEKVKGVIEPFLVALVAVLVMPASEMLGGYLLLAAVALFVTVNLHSGIQRVRALDMQDAFLDSASLADRFRGPRRD